MHLPPEYQAFASRRGDRRKTRAVGLGNDDDEDDDGPLQIKSPMSQSEEDLEEEEAEVDHEDEFVDAPDSQYNPNSEHAAVQTELRVQEPIPYTPSKPPPRPSFMARLTPALTPAPAPAPAKPPHESAADKKWRARVEQALVKMTAEVAALREQLEQRRLFSHSRKFLALRFVWRFVWGSVKHMAIDMVILGVVLLWMRRKQDRRLEGAIRVLLGDAVAQVQKVRGAQLGLSKLPNLVGKKGTSS